MHVKVKINLIIIITLIIGILIGAMINRAVTQHRIKNAISLMQPGFLPNIYRDLLQPDEEQARKIQQILERHADKIFQIRRDYQDDMTTANESLWAELQPILTPEQETRITRRFFRRRGMAGRTQGLSNHLLWNKIIEDELAWLKTKLSLSPNQVDQIRRVIRDPRIYSGQKQPRRQFRGMELDQAIRNFLTEEQKPIYEQIKEEWRQRLQMKTSRMRQKRE